MMFKDNWVKFGFGDRLSQNPSRTKPFIIDYSAARSHTTLTKPIDIAHEDCWTIYKTMPKPITLMVSGGVDSQAMAYAFKTSGVPDVRYVWARYNDGLNDHDFETSSFYAEHGIDVEVMDFDVIGFHENELLEWAKTYRNNSPHILTHCRIASLLEGTVVSSGTAVTRQGMGGMNYSVFGLERYSRLSGQPIIGFFLSFSAELCHSMLDINTSEILYEHKCKVFREAGFPILPQSKKLHGFENLKAHYDSVQIPAKVRLRYSKNESQRPYDLLFRYPLTEVVPYSQSCKTILPPR